MIVDDTLEMLERIKSAVQRQLPKVELPGTDEDLSIKVGTEMEVSRLREEANGLKEAFLAGLSEPQQAAWDQYRHALRENRKEGDIRDNPFSPEEVRGLRRTFIDTLDPDQKEQYDLYRKTRQEFSDAQHQLSVWKNRVSLRLFPSNILTVATVAFPESFSEVTKMTIQNILAAESNRLCNGVSLFRFAHHNVAGRLAGLEINIIGGQKDDLAQFLEVLGSTMHRLRKNLADPGLWKQVPVSRGRKGYCYVSSSAHGLNEDPILMAALSLAVHDPHYRDENALRYEVNGKLIDTEQLNKMQKRRGGTVIDAKSCIILSGRAAEDILHGNFGMDLNQIKEATRNRGLG